MLVSAVVVARFSFGFWFSMSSSEDADARTTPFNRFRCSCCRCCRVENDANDDVTPLKLTDDDAILFYEYVRSPAREEGVTQITRVIQTKRIEEKIFSCLFHIIQKLVAHIYKRKEKSNAARDVRCSGILITCLATLSLVVAIVVVVVVVVAFILYTKLIENSRDAVRAHQRRGNIYSQLDKVQAPKHVHSANRSGFFAWFWNLGLIEWM